MRLLVIRHAIAEDRATGGGDAERPLTARGRRRMRRAARRLRELVPEIELLASSPLVRARQTADIVARAYAGASCVETEALLPESPPEALAAWLGAAPRGATVAVVGHEPHLSSCVTWLLSGAKAPFMGLGKGGACLLELPGRVGPGGAELVWLLRPGQLRALR